MTRVGIVGLGEAGATIHLPALRGLADVAIAGVADPDPSRHGPATAAGIPSFASLDHMLRDVHPDVVIVASPPALHAAHCRAAMAAGADVLCEKPFAASVQEARSLLSEAERMSRRLWVNHEFRAMPVFRDVIAAARGDGSGPVVAQLWQMIDHNPASEKGWRGSLRRRALYEAGVHLVDIALQLFGETPRTVRASFAGAGAGGADAVVLVTLEFSRGRLCQLVQCRVHKGDRQYLEVRADTGSASLRASFGGRARVAVGFLRSTRPTLAFERGGSGVAWRESGAARDALSRNGGAPLVTSTRDVIRDCLAARASKARGAYDAAHGVAALRVIAAAYHSADTGRTVRLDEGLEPAVESLPLAEPLA